MNSKYISLIVIAATTFLLSSSCERNTDSGDDANLRVTSLILNSTSESITVGSTITLTATVTPANLNVTVNWASSNPAVATVSDGVVTGISVGSTTITATVGNFTSHCVITVQADTVAITGITLNSEVETVLVGSTVTLTATLTPANANTTVIWSSSNSAVATVNNGAVRGISAGTATITATAGAYSAQCVITVETPAVTSITLNRTVETVMIGSSLTLKATVRPANANAGVVWVSSNPSIATVSNSGTVLGLLEGSTTITASAGGITAICDITVISKEVPIEHGNSSPLIYPGYTLVWQDEFNESEISNDWGFEIGTGCPNLCGWGNDELQYYTRENAWVSNGVLTIEARRENLGGRQYTSARMITRNRESFQYGRIDIRALLPKGQGMWPALWMLGDNISTVGWPKCGEIDIMEMIGGQQRENTVHGTIHWHVDNHASTGSSFTLDQGTFYHKYHVFSIIWDQTHIRFLVDDVQFRQIEITANHMTEFHQKFFFIFNIAVGGRWPGNPDATTVFPQQMRVDYVRVFQASI